MTYAASDAEKAVRFEARIWREATTWTKEVRNPETGKWADVPTENPAEWGVYDTSNNVRIAYAHSEQEAKSAAEKWSSGKIPEQTKNKVESIRYLRLNSLGCSPTRALSHHNRPVEYRERSEESRNNDLHSSSTRPQ